MKKSKLKKIMHYVKRFVDGKYDKKMKNEEELINSLKKMKKRENKIKEKIKNMEGDDLKKLVQELEVIKKLRQKAKELLKNENK